MCPSFSVNLAVFGSGVGRGGGSCDGKIEGGKGDTSGG